MPHFHHLFGSRPGKYYAIGGNLSKKGSDAKNFWKSPRVKEDLEDHFNEEVFDGKTIAEISARDNYKNVWLYEVEVTPRDGNTPSTLIIKSLGTYFHGKYSPPEHGSFV